jgi:hypothetical protein
LGNQYLHVHGGQAHNDANVTTWEGVNQPNLHWILERVPNSNNYYLCTAVDRNFVLHQHGGNHDNGGQVTLWDKRTHPNNANVQVRIEDHHGMWKIIFSHSNKCAHVHGGGLANGTQISQWDFVDQANLLWVPEFEFHPHMLAGTGVRFGIQSGLGNQWLHVHGGQAHNDANLTTWEWVDQDNLKWTLERGDNNQFYICSAVNNHFVIHQHGGNHDNGGQCTLWDRTTHPHNANVQVTFDGHGEFWGIRFAHSGKYAHVHGGQLANGTQISQWDWVEQNNLRWRIIPLTH